MSETIKPNQERSLAFIHTGVMSDYFIDKGEAKYVQCVQTLELNLGAIKDIAYEGLDTNINRRLLLTPSQQIPKEMMQRKTKSAEETYDGTRVYGELPEPTVDLMLMTELLTHSRVLMDTRDSEGHGKVIAKGEYGESYTPVYFVENYGIDSTGDYLIWQVRNTAPPELAPTEVSTEEVPFVTQGERHRFFDEATDGLKGLKVNNIEEADIYWADQEAA